MYITDLSAEILSQIFANVSNKSDIYRCMNVCKQWRKVMLPLYYKDIVLQQNHEQFLRQVQKKIDDNKVRIGDFVESLTFGYNTETLLSQEDFDLLIDTLPFLRAIRFDASNTDKVVQYLEYLDRIASRTQLQEVSLLNYSSSNMEMDESKAAQLHYSINKQLKRQITTLELFETIIDADDSPGYQKIFSFIKEFANLKNLTFRNEGTSWGTRGDMDFAFVLDALSDDLQSFTYYTGYSLYPMTGSRYLPNLTALTLSLDHLDDHLVAYLIEHVPNLKELDLKLHEVYGSLLTQALNSLQTELYFKFQHYLKQLQRFSSSATACNSSFNYRNIFWPFIRDIYNGQDCCNLNMHFYVEGEYIEDFTHEIISFDTHTFNVECDFTTEEFSKISADSFDFLNLKSIHINYDKPNIRDIEDDRTLSDLLVFATAYQQPQIHLTMNSFPLKQLILSPNIFNYPFTFPRNKSPIQYAYLENAQLDTPLLENLCSRYPTIKNIRLVNYEAPTQDQDKDRYLVDLQQFKNLQELDFDQLKVIFQWTDNGEEKHYFYDWSVSQSTIFPMDSAKDIPKDTPIIKIKTFGLQRFIFKRCGRDVET